MAITALSDAELLDQARDGDEAAFTELYVRHQAAAHRLASTYKRVGDPDDLVNGAFERVLGALRRGAGPTEPFRAYLFVTLRRLAAEQGQWPADHPIDAVPEPVTDEADGPGLTGVDRELITKAFESLPDRWQAVLWHTAVEGRRPRELAAVLGVSANAAAAMAYRARERLRQSYLQTHLLASPAPEHEPYRSQLGAYVRDGLSAADREATERHLAGCEACRALVGELADVNRMLVRSVVPLFLLGGTGTATAAAASGAAAAGLSARPSSGSSPRPSPRSSSRPSPASSGSSTAAGAGSAARKLRSKAPAIGSVAVVVTVVAGMVGLGAVVSRKDRGPLDKAADAADIGPTGGLGGAGGAPRTEGGTGPGSRAGALSLFGSRDASLGPAAGAGLGVRGLGSAAFRLPPRDRFGLDGGPGSTGTATGPGSGSSAGTPPAPPAAPATPPAAPGGSPGGHPGTNPAGNPGGSPGGHPGGHPGSAPGGHPGTNPGRNPGTKPGGGGTTPPPAPPALEFSASAWTPTAVGRGTLAVTIGERAAPAGVAPSATPRVAAVTAPLRLEVTLSSGARAFPGAPLDARCSAPVALPAGGQRIDCTLTQPAPGASAELSLPLQVDAPGQTATLRLFRGTALEAALPAPVALDLYQAGLDLTDPTWTAVQVGGRALPIGRFAMGAVNRGTHAIPGSVVTVTIAGDGGFVPSSLLSQLPSDEFLDLLPLPPGLRAQLAQELLTPLPEGCAIEGWTPPGEGTTWSKVLRGGLPTTIACDLGTMAPGTTRSLGGLPAALRPLYLGTGKPDDATATVTLRLQDTVVATRSLDLAAVAPPAG